ncbi:hypothetical protein VNO77_22821 [Canavalia gladiata]|uniref:Uncharacterized protein n=1 Tax=Canavalia gladiata TaxID=3824 RepID=A0AAN9L6R1_CANGL
MPGASKGYADRGEVEDLCILVFPDMPTTASWPQVPGILAKEYPDVDSKSLDFRHELHSNRYTNDLQESNTQCAGLKSWQLSSKLTWPNWFSPLDYRLWLLNLWDVPLDYRLWLLNLWDVINLEETTPNETRKSQWSKGPRGHHKHGKSISADQTILSVPQNNDFHLKTFQTIRSRGDHVDNKKGKVINENGNLKQWLPRSSKGVIHDLSMNGSLSNSAEPEKNLQRDVYKKGQEDDGSNTPLCNSTSQLTPIHLRAPPPVKVVIQFSETCSGSSWSLSFDVPYDCLLEHRVWTPTDVLYESVAITGPNELPMGTPAICMPPLPVMIASSKNTKQTQKIGSLGIPAKDIQQTENSLACRIRGTADMHVLMNQSAISKKVLSKFQQDPENSRERRRFLLFCSWVVVPYNSLPSPPIDPANGSSIPISGSSTFIDQNFDDRVELVVIRSMNLVIIVSFLFEVVLILNGLHQSFELKSSINFEISDNLVFLICWSILISCLPTFLIFFSKSSE